MNPKFLQRFRAVVCRPALPMDTAGVLELTRTIWDGQDYVPEVWADWLADPQGLLAVAEYAGQVVGLVKLTVLAPGEWWLQGLRVHPQFQGRGIASRLHDFALAFWQRQGSGVMRLVTASFRKPVQHLCERTGFARLGEYAPYVAPALGEGEPRAFQPLEAAEIGRALAFGLGNPVAALNWGLFNLGWEWAAPSEKLLAEAAGRGQAWWWRDDQGLVALNVDPEAETPRPFLCWAACPLERLAELLLDYRRLAGWLGFTAAVWDTPLRPEAVAAAESAGFARDWDASLFLYEKQHPGVR